MEHVDYGVLQIFRRKKGRGGQTRCEEMVYGMPLFSSILALLG